MAREGSRWEQKRRQTKVKEMKNTEAIKRNLLSRENPFSRFPCSDWELNLSYGTTT